MNHKIGDRVSWITLNGIREGVVVGFYKTFAKVRVDGSGKLILLLNEPLKPKHHGYLDRH